MLRAALANHAGFVLDDGEFRIGEPTFTVNTLQRIRREVGDETPLVLIIGADQFLALETWRAWLQLFELAHIGVAERPGHGMDAARLSAALAAQLTARQASHIGHKPSGSVVRFAMTALDISSTLIRERIAAGRSPRYLLPEAVLGYIKSRHLYQKAPT